MTFVNPRITPAGSPVQLARENAWTELQAVFKQLGLPQALADWAYEQKVLGKEDAEIMFEIEQRPEFDARFPGIRMARENGVTPLSPGAYVEYETTAAENARRYGLDESFYKRGTSFDTLVSTAMANGVSARQYVERLDKGFARVAKAPPEIRAGFKKLFGIQGDAALASTFLNPDRPQDELEQMAAAAEFAGTGTRFGINLGLERSMELATYDFSLDQVRSGLGEVVAGSQLYGERLSETQDLTVEEEGIDATFGLNDEAKKALTSRREERHAVTGGTGAATQTKQGYGLGSAR